MYEDRLRKSEWEVRACSLKEAQDFIRQHHYSKGGSNTAVYTHGLYRLQDQTLYGVVWWIPPTRAACESVNKAQWKKVLSLTRMAVLPGAPKNACSFMLAASVKMIRKEGRFVSLVTYADESQGHSGGVYKASGWEYVGRTGPYPRWLAADGRQVSSKANVNRTKAQMEALGYVKVGSYYKHKYILHLAPVVNKPHTAEKTLLQFIPHCCRTDQSAAASTPRSTKEPTMTDLVTLFSNIDRIALSLERIATALEDRNAGGDNTISVSVSGETATVEKPKRTRRTKEQIAADEAAEKAAAQAQPFAPAEVTAPVQVAATFQPAVGQPAAIGIPQASESVGVAQIPATVPAAVAPPVTVPAASIPAAAPVPAPLAQPAAPQATATTPAPTATTPPVAAPVAQPTGTADGDFAQLYQILGPVWAVGRDHFVNNFSQYGLTLPISDPDNNALPGPSFRALSAEHRAHLLQTTAQLAAQIQARAGQL